MELAKYICGLQNRRLMFNSKGIKMILKWLVKPNDPETRLIIQIAVIFMKTMGN